MVLDNYVNSITIHLIEFNNHLFDRSTYNFSTIIARVQCALCILQIVVPKRETKNVVIGKLIINISNITNISDSTHKLAYCTLNNCRGGFFHKKTLCVYNSITDVIQRF